MRAEEKTEEHRCLYVNKKKRVEFTKIVVLKPFREKQKLNENKIHVFARKVRTRWRQDRWKLTFIFTYDSKLRPGIEYSRKRGNEENKC
jgi:hypothetical protein